MPYTPRGIFYPDGGWTFPPGLSGSGGAFQTVAESIDTAIDESSLVRIVSLRSTGTNSSLTFTDIPDIFEDLIIMWGGRKSQTAASFDNVGLRFNGDASQSYASGVKRGTMGSDTWNGDFGTFTVMRVGRVGNQSSSGWIHVPRYTRAASKDAFGWGTARNGAGTTNAGRTYVLAAGTWAGSAEEVVSSVTLSCGTGNTWAEGFVGTVYGTPKVA